MAKIHKRNGAANNASNATRRSHRKSRYGCKQCKQRHQRCDEQRPTCVNCSTSNQRCSYVDQLPSDQPPSPSQVKWRSETFSNPSISTLANSTTSLSGSPMPSNAATEGSSSGDNGGMSAPTSDRQPPSIYNQNHLALLHHLETAWQELSPAVLISDEKTARSFIEMIFRAAMSAPYLMDELLAFSALHLSSLHSDAITKTEYNHQARVLQTRALDVFNKAPPEAREDNSMAMFLFSSFLGLHTLYDTAQTVALEDFSEFLEKFTQYLSLHRGVHTVTSQAWHFIRHTEMSAILDVIDPVDGLQVHNADDGNGWEKLKELCTSAGTGHSPDSISFKAYQEAIKSLEWVMVRYGALPAPYRTHIILAWPVRISAEYINLLKQRQPEALVILAHWALLLHRERDFWVFGDTGRFLIESITKYLGAYWDEWLAWPKEVLGP